MREIIEKIVLAGFAKEAEAISKSWQLEIENQKPQDILALSNKKELGIIVFEYNTNTASILEELLSYKTSLKVIVVAKDATIADAVKALRLGCIDFLAKEILSEEVKKSVIDALNLEKDKKIAINNPWYFGKSPAIQLLFHNILRFGASENLILFGASGVGKKQISKIIQKNCFKKNNKTFSVNLALFFAKSNEQSFWSMISSICQKFESDIPGLYENLYDAIYLQGIESCPSDFLETLLAIIIDRTPKSIISSRIKIILGINSPETIEKIGENIDKFDIIKIPSLKERISDLPDIIEPLIKTYSSKYGSCIEAISIEALNMLMHYDWPGNMKELDSIIETAVILAGADESIIQTKHLSVDVKMLQNSVYQFGYNNELPLEQAEEIFKNKFIDFVADRFGEIKSANLLKIHKKDLKIKQ